MNSSAGFRPPKLSEINKLSCLFQVFFCPPQPHQMAQLENGSSKVAKGQDDLKNPGIERLHEIRGNYAGLPLLDSSLPPAVRQGSGVGAAVPPAAAQPHPLQTPG